MVAGANVHQSLWNDYLFYWSASWYIQIFFKLFKKHLILFIILRSLWIILYCLGITVCRMMGPVGWTCKSFPRKNLWHVFLFSLDSDRFDSEIHLVKAKRRGGSPLLYKHYVNTETWVFYNIIVFISVSHNRSETQTGQGYDVTEAQDQLPYLTRSIWLSTV